MAKATTKFFYSKSFKRKIITALSEKKSLYEIFKKEGFEIDSLIENDKRYISKLIYKWKEEFKEGKLTFIPVDVKNKTIEDEILKLDNFINKDFYNKNYYYDFDLSCKKTLKARISVSNTQY